MAADLTAPLIFAKSGILITAHEHRLTAILPDAAFTGLSSEHAKSFPHVDNLHDLPLRGLLRLAEEFYSELTSNNQRGGTL